MTPTATVTPTSTISSTPSVTPTNTVTPTASSTPPESPSTTPTVTPTNTVTPTSTITPTNTVTPTSSVSATPSVTPSNTITPTPTPTPTSSPPEAPSSDIQVFTISNTDATYSSTIIQSNLLNSDKDLNWPNGATKFKIHGQAGGFGEPQSSTYTSTFDLIVGGATQSNTSPEFGGFPSIGEGVFPMPAWEQIDSNNSRPITTSTSKIPNNVTLASATIGLYGFGLVECDNLDCNSPVRKDEIVKGSNNRVAFFIQQAPDTSNFNSSPAVMGTNPFSIQFSGQWLFD